MSAWKNPSRSAWRRNSCSTRVPTAACGHGPPRRWPRCRPAGCPRPSPASSPAPRQEPLHRAARESRDHRLRCWRRIRGRRGLEPQVQLAHHHALEMRDHVAGAPARGGRERLDHPGDQVEGVDILAEGALDPGRRTLTATVSPCPASRAGAPARSRPRRPARKTRKTARLDRLLAQFSRSTALGLVDGKGRQLVLQDRSCCASRRPPRRAASTGSGRT
jgi:hypothetical protein